MIIRKAESKDIDRINHLLYQVAEIHREGEPDVFKPATKKYSDKQLEEIIKDSQTPVFVAVDENDLVVGYAFCIHQQTKDNILLIDTNTLFIDDLCVDSTCRGGGIGYALYSYVKNYAQSSGCDRITLNVWNFNESAINFYKKCGFTPLKVVMMQKLLINN